MIVFKQKTAYEVRISDWSSDVCSSDLSKGAVTSWTRSIAASWGRYGITANTIVPAMWTPMYDEHRAQFTAEELVAHDAAMAQLIAIDGRLGNPSRDLVPLIIFLPGEGSQTGRAPCRERVGQYV